MDDINTEFIIDDAAHNDLKKSPPLYKEWNRGAQNSRFLSISNFGSAAKFKIEIGLTDSKTNDLISATEAYVPHIDFITYVNVLALSSHGNTIYPQNPKYGALTLEGIAFYGGSVIDGSPVSRAFRSHYWSNSDNTFDLGSFNWGIAHFPAKQVGSGAFIQTSKEPIKSNSMKVSRLTIAKIAITLNAKHYSGQLNDY